MRPNRTRTTIASLAVLLAMTVGGCTGKSMPGQVSKLPLSPGAIITAASMGRDGQVWFAALHNGLGPSIGSIDADGAIETTQLDPVSYGHVIGDLAIDVHHGVWATMPCYPFGSHCKSGFARFGGDYGPLTKITPLGNPDPMPLGIATTDDGGAWIAERSANAIVHVLPDGRRTTIAVGDPAFKPVGVQADDEGGAFFDGPEPGKILAVNHDGRIHWYLLPERASHTSSARQGLDGTVYVAEYDADKIVAIDSRGRMTEDTVPTPNAGPAAITIDNHGDVWFIESDGQKLGRIKSGGRIVDAYLPVDVGTPDYLLTAPNDVLVVIGHTKGVLNTSISWAVARIPESTTGL
jgi:streptogramin lyase